MKRRFIKRPVQANALLTPNQTRDAVEQLRPFDKASFDQIYRTDDDYADGIQAESVEVGDVISIDYSSDQLNIGIVVEVTDVTENHYGMNEQDFEIVLTVKVVEGDNTTKEGSIHTLTYDEDEWVGHVIG